MKTNKNSIDKSLLCNPVHLLSLGFGSGLSPIAPGTFGTLVGVGIYLLVMAFPFVWYLLLTLIAALCGIYLCEQTSRALQVSDHPAIVWDEIVGYLITMMFAPMGWQWIIAGFVLFRLFDILKPWPIGLLDRRIKGGAGVMLDDVVAGLFSACCLAALEYSKLII